MTTWKHQSYRPNPGTLAASQTSPTFIPWSPPGTVTVDDDWTTGTLELVVGENTLRLALTFQVTEGNPKRLSISAAMGQFTNELQGWFVPAKLGEEVSEDNPLVVRGSIVQTSEVAPDKQPIFTAGFFVLEPL